MRVILIDDEQLALDYFEYQLKSISEFKVIGKYTKPLEGKRAIAEQDVDVVFLDIKIPKLSGMELAEQLLEIKPNLPIIFVTAYDEYAVKAFELNALDYVLKPVSAKRLLTTVNRILEREEEDSEESVEGALKLTLFKQVNLFKGERCKENLLPLKWRTYKTEQLFLYLLHHREQVINKVVLVEILWPDVDLDKAYQQLYTSIYNIRQTLKDYSAYFQIKSKADGYVMHIENVRIDAEQFEKQLDTEQLLSEQTITKYEEALQLFRGDYLEDYDYIWTANEKQRFQVQWLSLAYKVINYYDEKNEADKQISLLMDILERFPLEEEAYFYMMKIAGKMGNHVMVQQHYEKLEKVLDDELAVAPREDIFMWYKEWRAKNTIADPS